MPSVSRQQQKLMFAAAKSPAVALRMGVPQRVAQHYAAADIARGPTKLPARARKK
jgi:hypothetical protein